MGFTFLAGNETDTKQKFDMLPTDTLIRMTPDEVLEMREEYPQIINSNGLLPEYDMRHRMVTSIDCFGHFQGCMNDFLKGVVIVVLFFEQTFAKKQGNSKRRFRIVLDFMVSGNQSDRYTWQKEGLYKPMFFCQLPDFLGWN